MSEREPASMRRPPHRVRGATSCLQQTRGCVSPRLEENYQLLQRFSCSLLLTYGEACGRLVQMIINNHEVVFELELNLGAILCLSCASLCGS